MHVLAASPKIMRNRREHASEHGWEHAGSAIVPHQLRNRGNMHLGCTYIHRMLIHGCTMVMVVEGLYIVVQTIVIEIKLSWLVGDNLWLQLVRIWDSNMIPPYTVICGDWMG